MKLIEWKSALSEISTIEHFHHPGLRYAKFIFCDDLPNENGQGIEHEDFASIIQSAVGAPVKMKFLGEGISGHLGSIPIGYINDMVETTSEDDKIHYLVASAVLFAHEYPDEVAFLEESFAEGKAPGISWELGYKDTIIKGGINWLKGIITRAATFVRNPAYGSRTALLALASNKTLSAEDFSTELSAFADEFSPKIPDKGGNIMSEEEIKKLQEDLAKALAAVETLEAEKATLETAHGTLTAEVESKDTIIAEKEAALAEVAARDLIVARTRMITEAGIKIETDEEKLAKKQAFWAALSDEAFAEYVDDLKAAAVPAKPKEALASLRTQDLPRFNPAPTDQRTTSSDLVAKFRNLRYSNAEENE